jgi:hypothetical protein
MNTNSPIITVPSWVIAGTYAENLRFLEDKEEIDGVELLFFIYNDGVKDELDSQWEEIRRYRERFIFTAHLPDPLLPAYKELISRLAPLARHFIVHPAVENPTAQARLLSEWAKNYSVIFLTQNTKHGLLEAQLPRMEPNAGICMDTGRLLLEGQNPADFFTKYRERIKEIHLHSVDKDQAVSDGKLIDHRRLRGDEKWLLELLPLLNDYHELINSEVFSWEEARAGIEIITNSLAPNKLRSQQ